MTANVEYTICSQLSEHSPALHAVTEEIFLNLSAVCWAISPWEGILILEQLDLQPFRKMFLRQAMLIQVALIPVCCFLGQWPCFPLNEIPKFFKGLYHTSVWKLFNWVKEWTVHFSNRSRIYIWSMASAFWPEETVYCVHFRVKLGRQ